MQVVPQTTLARMQKDSWVPYQPRCLDLFCGIGGLTLGLECAGFKSIGGIDKWEDAKETFEHNLYPLRCMISDLTQTSVKEIEAFFGISREEIDVIAGGPPCQGFSTVGKRELDDPRNLLWEHYRDLVSEIRPSYVIIENVEGMKVAGNGSVPKNVIAAFREVGYEMKARLLTSADYGVPQLRKRLVFLGWLSGLAEPHFPKPTVYEHVTVADAIFDLPKLKAGQKRVRYDEVPSTPFQEARRKNAKKLHNHEAANHSPHLVEIMKHVPDGGNRKSIPDHLQPKSGFHNSYARLASWKPAVAVTSNMRKPSSARSTHPKQPRGLTVREGLRLQTFDDDFVVLGTRTSQYLQVGNAVPPLLGQAVGEEVIRAFRANAKEQLQEAHSKVVIPNPVPVESQIALPFPQEV